MVLAKIAAMSEDEIALFVKSFKGLCNKCGKYGHKGVDCREKEKDDEKPPSKSFFNGKCYHCGTGGHRKADCRKLKAQQETAAFACMEDKQDSESFDELGLLARFGETAHFSEPDGRKQVHFQTVPKYASS